MIGDENEMTNCVLQHKNSAVEHRSCRIDDHIAMILMINLNLLGNDPYLVFGLWYYDRNNEEVGCIVGWLLSWLLLELMTDDTVSYCEMRVLSAEC